jgi:crossover junction endodeoxyribonuclease RusA
MTTLLGPPPAGLVVRFEVRGVPAPQGSKHARPIYRKGDGGQREFTGKVAQVESSAKRVRAWRYDVMDAAQRAMQDHAAQHGQTEGALFPFDTSLRLGLVFSLQRPADHYGTGRNAGVLRATAPAWPATTPDLSKLTRATEDALEHVGMIGNDKLIVAYDELRKVYAGSAHPLALPVPGAVITIRRAEP